jgi:hypothetical protein
MEMKLLLLLACVLVLVLVLACVLLALMLLVSQLGFSAPDRLVQQPNHSKAA